MLKHSLEYSTKLSYYQHIIVVLNYQLKLVKRNLKSMDVYKVKTDIIHSSLSPTLFYFLEILPRDNWCILTTIFLCTFMQLP